MDRNTTSDLPKRTTVNLDATRVVMCSKGVSDGSIRDESDSDVSRPRSLNEDVR